MTRPPTRCLHNEAQVSCAAAKATAWGHWRHGGRLHERMPTTQKKKAGNCLKGVMRKSEGHFASRINQPRMPLHGPQERAHHRSWPAGWSPLRLPAQPCGPLPSAQQPRAGRVPHRNTHEVRSGGHAKAAREYKVEPRLALARQAICAVHKVSWGWEACSRVGEVAYAKQGGMFRRRPGAGKLLSRTGQEGLRHE